MRETHQSDSSHFLRQAAATTSAASVRGRICLPCAQFVWRILSLFNGHVKDMFFFYYYRQADKTQSKNYFVRAKILNITALLFFNFTE